MYSLLSILALVSATATLANTHAILVQPAARPGSNGADNLGIKIPSPQDAQFFNTCGNAALQPGAPQATVAQGRQLQVRWDITIDHASDPGVTVGLRCAGERDFVQLATGVRAQDLQAQVTIPRAARVGNCELQWLWTSREDGGSYIACSDIAVTAGEGGNADPAPPAVIETEPLGKNQNKNRGGHQQHRGGHGGGKHNRGKHHNRPHTKTRRPPPPPPPPTTKPPPPPPPTTKPPPPPPPTTKPPPPPPPTTTVPPPPPPTTTVPPPPPPTTTVPPPPPPTTTAPPPPPPTTRPCPTTVIPTPTTVPCTTSQVPRTTTPCTTQRTQYTAIPTQGSGYTGANGQAAPEVPAPPAPDAPGEGGANVPNPVGQPPFSADEGAAPAPADPAVPAPADPAAPAPPEPAAPAPAEPAPGANAVNEQSSPSSTAEKVAISPAGEEVNSATNMDGTGFVTLLSVLVAAIFA